MNPHAILLINIAINFKKSKMPPSETTRYTECMYIDQIIQRFFANAWNCTKFRIWDRI